MTDKKKNQTGPRKGGNPKYPLSNLVSCTECTDKRYGRYVGFDHGNGKNKALVYEKYRCRSCKRYLTREDMHSLIKRHMQAYKLQAAEQDDLLSALNTVWKQQEGQVEQDSNRIRHQIKVLNEAVANAVIKDDILAAIGSKKAEISDLEQQLEEMNQYAASDKEQFLKFALGFVENLSTNFYEISQENRLRCKQLLFPGGFFLNAQNKVYTPEISPLYRLATKKKDAEASENSHLVRVTRLKLVASSLARKRSIN